MPYNLWPRGDMRSHDQLKTKYFLFYKAYDQKTCQGSDLWLGELTNDVAQPSDQVVKWDHTAI